MSIEDISSIHYLFAVKAKLVGILLWGLLSTSFAAPSWGAKGHRIIVAVAYQYLSPSAKDLLDRRLSPMTIGDASIWADQVRNESKYEHTASWHYATIPEGMYYTDTLAPKEGDLITAIEEQLQTLSTSGSLSSQAFALRMLLHLVGDMHQPLHIGNDKDSGGNEVELTFFGKKVSLHYLWDRDMIDTTPGGVNSWAKRLRSILRPEQQLKWTKGGPRDWIEETLSYRSQLYEKLPYDSSSSVRYYRQHQQLLDQLLLQAGLRLATLLNQITSK